MGYVKQKFDKKVRDAFEYYAKKYLVDNDKVQLEMYLKPEPYTNRLSPEFKVCVNYETKEDIGFISIIHPGPKPPKIDFTGLSALVPPIIGKMLFEMAQAKQIDPLKIRVFAILVKNETKQKIILWLYNGNVDMGRLDEDEILSDDKIVTNE